MTTPFEIPDTAQVADAAAEFDPRCLENEEAHFQQQARLDQADPYAAPVPYTLTPRAEAYLLDAVGTPDQAAIDETFGRYAEPEAGA